MRCIICGEPIFYKLKIQDLGYFKFTCKKCSKMLKPKHVEIPVDHGYLIYYYYFLTDDEYENEVSSRINEPIMNLIKDNKEKTIVFLDEGITEDIELFNFCQNILLVSLKYMPPEIYLCGED